MIKATLTVEDFSRAADSLGVRVPEIKTVCEVEAPLGGFLPSGLPVILFERHQFSRRTDGRYDESHPSISSPKAGGYKGGQAEHLRLDEAAQLDRTAALESASWGKFQIMGFNHIAAGHPTLQGFINAMFSSEGEQLDAFVNIIKSWGLADELREHRWADFAKRYNGANYAINKYDEKLLAAYRKWSA